jgi:hypothetical protein
MPAVRPVNARCRSRRPRPAGGQLAGLKSLDKLELRALDVTDVGLKELAELKNLKSLALASTKITDAGVKELARAHKPKRHRRRSSDQ